MIARCAQIMEIICLTTRYSVEHTRYAHPQLDRTQRVIQKMVTSHDEGSARGKREEEGVSNNEGRVLKNIWGQEGFELLFPTQ